MPATDLPLAESAPLTWRQQFQQAIRDPIELCEQLRLSPSLHAAAIQAAKQFPLFAPQNYVQRMKSGDPADPLLRQVLPIEEELVDTPGFTDDPVGDGVAKQQPGLIQKYRGRVLLITTGTCAIHCRYCFRRHYPYQDDPKSLEQWQPAIEQIKSDTSVHEVILSGGDPLSLSDTRLQQLVQQLDSIPHLRRLRIHTRLPIVIPARVTDELVGWLTGTTMQPFLVLHANHANELSDEVLAGFDRVRKSGVTLLNQAVLLAGINDSVDALRELCELLSNHGVLPYYLNQLDRVRGAAHFEVSQQRGMELIEQLRTLLPGYAVPRYVREIEGEPNKSILL